MRINCAHPTQREGVFVVFRESTQGGEAVLNSAFYRFYLISTGPVHSLRSKREKILGERKIKKLHYLWKAAKFKLRVYYCYILKFYIVFYKMKYIRLRTFTVFSMTSSHVTSMSLYTFNNAIAFNRSCLVVIRL